MLIWKLLDQSILLTYGPGRGTRLAGIETTFDSNGSTAIISRCADVTLDKEGGEIQSLAMVDYKTSTDPEANEDYGLRAPRCEKPIQVGASGEQPLTRTARPPSCMRITADVAGRAELISRHSPVPANR